MSATASVKRNATDPELLQTEARSSAPVHVTPPPRPRTLKETVRVLRE